ncbi:MAG: glycosyltransferase, partial [Planctomycetes bacterium]|nr:glycosyltransferase [Planctomycetota bacterium]
MGSRLISIVVPVYNEVESLDDLVAEIRDVAARNALEVEVVLVDDGSRDASWEKIVSLAQEGQRV